MFLCIADDMEKINLKLFVFVTLTLKFVTKCYVGNIVCGNLKHAGHSDPIETESET